MNKNFTKDDLKVGYVVKLRNDRMFMVMPIVGDDMAFCGASGYIPVRSFNSDLRCSSFAGMSDLDIMEVYGLTTGGFAYDINSANRELLWKREEAKKMTVAEIEKELGYKVEVVADADKPDN